MEREHALCVVLTFSSFHPQTPPRTHNNMASILGPVEEVPTSLKPSIVLESTQWMRRAQWLYQVPQRRRCQHCSSLCLGVNWLFKHLATNAAPDTLGRWEGSRCYKLVSLIYDMKAGVLPSGTFCEVIVIFLVMWFLD